MAERLLSLVLAMLGATACGSATPTASTVEPLAEEVPLPRMHVGDMFEYESRAPAMGVDGAPKRWSVTVIAVHADGSYEANIAGVEAVGGRPYVQLTRFAAPWNHVPPPPYAAPESLRFPLRQGASWNSVAPNPTINLTQAVSLTVKGRQVLEIAGTKVDCVRVEGTSTQTTTLAVTSPMRLWYCPSLRAVGRVETDLPMGPVTQTLVAHRLQS